MDDRPIGMFDSGFGGLTVARALIDLLPDEDLVYFGDTGRYPYGPAAARRGAGVRPPDHRRAGRAARREAGGRGLQHRRGRRPRAAALRVRRAGRRRDRARRAGRWSQATRNGRVGVIGTVGTIGVGRLPAGGAAARARRSTLTCAACPGFVEFVERGETESEQVHVLAERLLAPVRAGGRRHPAARLHPLPVPRPHDQRRDGPRRRAGVVGRRDRVRGAGDPGDTGPGPAHARARARHRFVSSGDVEWFRELGGRLLGPELDGVEALGVGLTRHRPRLLGHLPGPGRRVQRLPGRATARPVWLDAGSGTLANLQRHVGLDDVDAVVLSHEHPDHWTDLEGYHIAVPLRRSTARGRARVRAGRPAASARTTPTRADVRLARRWPTATGSRSATLSRHVLPHRPRARDAGRARRRRRPVARLLGRHRAGLVARGARARARPGAVRGDASPATRRARCST